MSDPERAASAFAWALEQATRPDGTHYVRLQQGAPSWMRKSFYAAHQGRVADDWTCDIIQSYVEARADGIDPEDAYPEPDIYTADLLDWVRGPGSGHLDQALNEGSDAPHFKLMQGALRSHIEEICYIIEAALDAYEDEDEDPTPNED